jgi:hypothetical protein
LGPQRLFALIQALDLPQQVAVPGLMGLDLKQGRLNEVRVVGGVEL